MNLSALFEKVIDPRASVHIDAACAVYSDPELRKKAETFLEVQEGFGGYNREEILEKWDRRIAKRLRIKERLTFSGGYLLYDGVQIGGPFPPNQQTAAIDRALFRLTCGLLPSTYIELFKGECNV
jgi:hypothetical protein